MKKIYVLIFLIIPFINVYSENKKGIIVLLIVSSMIEKFFEVSIPQYSREYLQNNNNNNKY